MNDPVRPSYQQKILDAISTSAEREFLWGFCIKLYSLLHLLKPLLFPWLYSKSVQATVELLSIQKYTNKAFCHIPVKAAMAIKKQVFKSHSTF